jgi:2-keto-4-pentenoate hydratase/2-oxohepta-3-ene-1,7-dioic acid hydratase in catechol pathway
MRLVTFRALGDGEAGQRIGALLPDGRLVDLVSGFAAYQQSRRNGGSGGSGDGPRMPGEMVAFFEGGRTTRDMAESVLGFAGDALSRGDAPRGPRGETVVHEPGTVKLLAPVPRPRRIRDYLTYPAHAAGSGLALPEAFAAMPICYKGNIDSVIGPDEEIVWPAYSDQLDYELEIGFYTGKGGRNIPAEQAGDYIAAVTIFNDVSARDIQMFEMSLRIGPSKGKDFCNVMGPCAVTPDEIDEFNLKMQARVNGEVWTDAVSRERQFSFAEILAWASYCEDVYPGEFMAVGTVGGGCGLELDRWLKPGDVVELEVEGIGVLRNRYGQREQVPANAGLKTYRIPEPVHPGPH